MPKASPIQYAFNVGEISPLLYGRVDQEWYGSALAECQRYIPLIQGPITRCPGTYFVAEVKDSSAKTLVRRFEFSTTQAYILEFGNQYLRFYKDNAQIALTAQNVSGVTNANPAVLTYVGADTYANGNRVVITGVGGMTQLNNREFTVANVNTGANTFELSGVNSTAYGAYTSGGTVAEIYEISTPYLTADLPSLYVRVQSADTLYIFHPSYAPRKLTRTAHTSWTLSQITFLDGPYLPTNATATTLTLSGTTGSVTVTASAPVFTVTTDIGRLIRWKDPAGNWTWLTITATASTTSVTATISGANASAGTATVNWRLGVWSTTTGFPGCGSFFEDRLFAAGATNYPTRLDGSRTGDYENFAPSDANGTTITDSHAVSFSLNSNTVNNIRWLLDDEHGLLAGTIGGEWLIRPSALGTPLTPTNISAKQSTAHGSANIPAIRTGKTPIFVQRAGRKLRELSYDYRSDGLISSDKTTRAEHITKGGITEIAYQQEPHSIAWAVRADGVLLGFTYEYEQDVTAWHRHPLGGSFSTGGAVVESVAVIPSMDGTRDELWMTVKRTINGATKRTIEYMPAIFSDGDDIATDAFFVDCGLTYSGSPTTVVTGLNHLEGQTVSILADGAAKTPAVVVGGSITIPVAASTIHVGLGYTSRVRALRLTAGAADGTSQGKLQRIIRVVVRFLASVGLDVGPMREDGTDNLSALNFYTSGMDTDTAIPPFSGDRKVPWEGNYDRTAWMVFQQSQPLPSTITALMPQVEVEDES
jgi:hypothetical protein